MSNEPSPVRLSGQLDLSVGVCVCGGGVPSCGVSRPRQTTTLPQCWEVYSAWKGNSNMVPATKPPDIGGSMSFGTGPDLRTSPRYRSIAEA